MVRQPAATGSFYAGTASGLRGEVEGCLSEAHVLAARGVAIGAVYPHAGLRFSGKTAGAVYARMDPPETLVILGPNHHGVGAAAALPSHAQWEAPLGPMAIDGELPEAISAAAPSVEVDDLLHAREHSIEVQIPFVRYLMPEVRLVPISVGLVGRETVQEIGRGAAEGVRATGRRAVVVASTDFSHYVLRAVAERKDRHAIQAIGALDPDGLLAAVRRERIAM